MTTETKQKKITKSQLRAARHIFAYILPYKGYFLLGMFFLVASSLIFMLIPATVGQMLKAAKGETFIPQLRVNLEIHQYIWVFIAILLLQGIMSFFRVNFFAIVTENALAKIRIDVYNKLLSQPLVFFEKRRVGEIVSRLSADVEKLQQAYSVTLAEFIRQLITFLVGVVVLFLFSVKLTLVMLAVFPLVIILALIFGRIIKKMSKQRQDYLAETNVIVDETFQSFIAVKAFVNEYFELNRYTGKINNLVKVALRFARAKGLFFTFIITCLFGALFFILWMGGLQVYNGNLDVEELTAFIFYAMVIGGAIASLGSQYTEILSALGATERIKEILDTDKELNIVAENIKPINFAKEIQFKKVSFSYPTREDVEVLKSISFTVKKGQKIALVGSSGSGKSTIVKLLNRFYETSKGEITIDSIDINNFEVKALRKIIGIVPQEVILFGGSILENIQYGNINASFEQVVEVAKQANAYDFIQNFPDKFDTLVGERGVQLSGGQKQRIAIARALLKNPDILILDEATSSLDASSEKQVQDALEHLMLNRTTFIIAHRLSTVRNADNILVVNNGEIVEQGTHLKLIENKNGTYNQLLKLQIEAS